MATRLAAVCKKAGISRQRLCNWMQKDCDLLDKYARMRARQRCVDFLAEKILEIDDEVAASRLFKTSPHVSMVILRAALLLAIIQEQLFLIAAIIPTESAGGIRCPRRP